MRRPPPLPTVTDLALLVLVAPATTAPLRAAEPHPTSNAATSWRLTVGDLYDPQSALGREHRVRFDTEGLVKSVELAASGTSEPVSYAFVTEPSPSTLRLECEHKKAEIEAGGARLHRRGGLGGISFFQGSHLR